MQWDRPGLLAQRVLPAQPELLVQLAQTVRWDRLGRRALMVRLAQRVRPARRELLELLAQLVQTVRLVLPVQPAPLVLLAPPALPVPLAQPALMVRPLLCAEYTHSLQAIHLYRKTSLLLTIQCSLTIAAE